ncbi:MAG: ankyrin repeat domain-containing protein [Terrimesophilobacter sp.]
MNNEKTNYAHDSENLVHRYLQSAGSGDIAGVLAAISESVPLDAQSRRRETAVLRAARGGHLEIVEVLIAAGIDIDLQDDICQNPFLYGCIVGNTALVRMMVKAGTDINRLTRFGGNGLTPAAEKGHLGVVRYLLENTEIDVNLTNTVGWTALIEAIILGDGGQTQQDIVRLLLLHGADPSMTDEWGVAPIELAQRKGFKEIAILLSEAQPMSGN